MPVFFASSGASERNFSNFLGVPFPDTSNFLLVAQLYAQNTNPGLAFDTEIKLPAHSC